MEREGNVWVERQDIRDYLQIFTDTCGPSRMNTTFNSPVKDYSCFSTPRLLASSHDSGISQSNSHNLLSFQPGSPVITIQPIRSFGLLVLTL